MTRVEGVPGLRSFQRRVRVQNLRQSFAPVSYTGSSRLLQRLEVADPPCFGPGNLAVEYSQSIR